MKLALGFVFAGLLLLFPVEALEAARQAMAVWAGAYAPAMLPFFIILPVLSGAEAAALYERVFGRVMGLVFGCPGRAAGGVALGLIAGSPAGGIALGRLAGGMKRCELSRAALLCTGLSPLFLVSAVGASMLGSAQAGAILARAQLGAMLLCALVFRWCWRGDDAEALPIAVDAPGGAVRDAALNVMSVCGYIVLFSVIAHLLAQLTGPQFEPWLLPLIEVTGGCAQLSRLDLPWAARLVLMAFVCGFSGLCVLMQNLSRLRALGLPWGRLVLGKLLHGIASALLCALQLRLLPLPAASPDAPPDACPAALAAALLILVVGGIVMLRRRGFHRDQKVV